MEKNDLHLVGYASGVAGADVRVSEGPLVMQKSPYLSALTNERGMTFNWEAMICPSQPSSLRMDETVAALTQELALSISALTQKQKFFTVIGGDHSCAIGTWSGVYDAVHQQGDFGLIWIDAHMDGHTPETSLSGRIHGMPVASLLGYGYPTLTGILNANPKIKPQHLCLIGTRSFEDGEAALLKRLNVRIFYMDEVKQRGIGNVLDEALEIVNQGTIGYGVSLDLDGIDPLQAPAVDVPEKDGIQADELRKALIKIVSDSRLIGAEIVEFDPSKDENQITEKLVAGLLGDFVAGRK